MRRLPVLLALGLMAAAPAAFATPGRASATFPGPQVRMEVIDLPSAPPGQMAEAPGGGVVTTPAALFNPASGENAYGPAVVMIGEGPDFNPMREGDPARFAAAALAARGYTVLSLYTHLVRGYSLFPFEATGAQIDAALYFLEQRGHAGLILAGKGYGAVAAADYLKTHSDKAIDSPGEKRVKALLLFSPLTELRAYPRADLDRPGYAAEAEAAKASVERGTGRYPAGNTLEVGSTLTGKADSWMASGPFNGPPESFQSYWSLDAERRNLDALAAVKVPTLVLGAGKDPTYSEAHLRTVMHTVPLEVERFPDAGLLFPPDAQAKSSADAASWLARRGLGPKPAVTEAVIDATMADGRTLPAVVYAPAAGADPKRPAILFLHGRTEDPLQSSGHWVATRLAQKGYVVFTVETRASGAAGFASALLTDVADDIGRWSARIGGFGYGKLVAVGHSNGGIYISTYMAKSHDPRIEGVVFMAPTVNEREHTIQRDGAAKVDRDLAEAKAAIDRGEGLTHMIGYMTSRVYWDANRPGTISTHTERIREYSVPTLSIVGSTDALFQNTDFLDRFIGGQKPSLAKLIRLSGGTHGMRESKDAVAADIDGWIRETFPSRP